MSLQITIIISLVVAICVLFLVRNYQNNPPAKKAELQPSQTTKSGSKYHAVSIKVTGRSCEASRELVGKRFLSNAAPRLPLPECNWADCKCVFVHYDDRRTGRDRRSPLRSNISSETGEYAVEQRSTKDRRSDPIDEL